MESTDWEHSKENIQPLRTGRKASSLVNAGGLTPSRAKELQEEKNKFEAALRTNDGKDPLEPWINYITWVEQTYPKGGKEGNLAVLLEKCIKQFKDDKVYSQDVRYLDIWNKYASMAQKPLDLYNFMHSNQLCTALPEFYIYWAWYLEEDGNYKKAEQAFKAGVQMVDHNDEKFELLETKHRQFQARVMKRMVNNSDVGEMAQLSSGEEERAVLGSLQGHGKHQKVGSIRVGSAKKSDHPGSLPLSSHSSSSHSNRQGFSIFQDSEVQNPIESKSTITASKVFPFAKEQNRENEMNAGKWTNSNIGRKKQSVPLDKISMAPHFEIHNDAGLEQPSGPTPHKLQPGESNVLSTRKVVADEDDQKDVAVALFEPLDPTKRPMYCKHLVYQGTTEFSFEEIRGARWKKRWEEQEMKKKQEEMANMMKQMEEEKDAMRKQIEEERKMIKEQQDELRKEQERLRAQQEDAMRQQEEAMKRQHQDMIRQQQELEKLKADMKNQIQQVQKQSSRSTISPSSSSNSIGVKVNSCQSSSSGIMSSEFSSQSRETPTNPSNLQKSSSFLEDTRALLQSNPLVSTIPSLNEDYESNPNSLHKTPSRMDCLPPVSLKNSGNKLSQPSPTVNTREAQMLMQQMWGYQGGSSRTKETILNDEECDQAAPFAIYQDNGGAKSLSTNARNPAAIPIFCDENNAPRQISKSKKKAIPLSLREEDMEKPSVSEPKIDEDKENKPPSEHQFNSKKVPTNGPLLPSRHVKCVPLDLQEKVLDDDEREQEIAYEIESKVLEVQKSLPTLPIEKLVDTTSNPNQTMFLPTAEDFEDMARKMSTPIHGRRFVPEEEEEYENTCAVQLAFKQPLPVASQIAQRVENNDQKAQELKVSNVEKECIRKDLSSEIESVGQNNPVISIDEHVETNNQTEQQIPTPPENKMNVMSPIMETSREYNYKSSSSSSESQWHVTSNKSHWNGNNTTAGSIQPITNNAVVSGLSARTPGSMLSKSTFSKSKTMGHIPQEMTCSSGYIADASSARTPGIFLQPSLKHDDSKNPQTSAGYSNIKPATIMDKDEDDDEPTGLLGIMNEFKEGAGLMQLSNTSNQANILKSAQRQKTIQTPLLQVPAYDQSMQGNTTDVSMLAGGEPTPFKLKTPSLKASFLSGSTIMHDNFNSPASPIMAAPMLCTKSRNSCEPELGELTQDFFKTDVDEPNLELTQHQEDVNDVLVDYNPLDTSMHQKILKDLKVPVSQRHGYYATKTNMPLIRPNSIVQVGPTKFNVKECKGEGGYGKVFRASRPIEDTTPNETIAEMDSVLKVQKPQPNEWEFYICTELHQRLSSADDKKWFMSIPRCYVFNDGSIFVSEHQPFTLLDVCNKISSIRDINSRELLAVYFAIEMLHILEKLRKAYIIHADFKPENFMMQAMPKLNDSAENATELFQGIRPSLILIDFGVSIDMAVLPEKAQFEFQFEKQENRIPEMLDNKPWNYQVDYFGVASIIHTILHGSYIKVTRNNGRYEPAGKPKRWWNLDLWNDFFDTFLNIQDCTSLPDLTQTRESFESFFYEKYRTRYQKVVFELGNELYRK